MSRSASATTARAARLSLVLGLAAIALLVALLATARGPGPRQGPTPPLRTGELSAEGLVHSIGVVVHFNYVDTAYRDQAGVLTRLRELGVEHIRDAVPSPGERLAIGLHAASLQGIRATLNSGDLRRDPAAAMVDSLRVMGRGIDAFEGPNELDNSGAADWVQELVAYMPALDAAARRVAPGVPVIGPSLIDPAHYRRLPANLPGIFNEHPYPHGGPPEPALGTALRSLPATASTRGVVFTETGYQNALRATTGQPPVSEEAAATYLPRLLVTAYAAGVRRTLLYELLDEKPDPGLVDPEQHFGLLRNDLTPKPAFAAVRTLIGAIESSPGPGDPAALRWSLGVGAAGEVKRVTLVRRDGSHVLALWRPVSVWNEVAGRPIRPSALPVELALGRTVHDLEVWRPSASARPVLRLGAVSRLELSLGGDLVLVSFR